MLRSLVFKQNSSDLRHLSSQRGERSGSVVECLTRDQGAADFSLTGVTVLWSLSKTHLSYLSTGQPRKTRPCLTERLLMGRKESNQTDKISPEEINLSRH